MAAVLERALPKQRAPTRVPVTPSARLDRTARGCCRDRAWDRVIVRQYGGLDWTDRRSALLRTQRLKFHVVAWLLGCPGASRGRDRG